MIGAFLIGLVIVLTLIFVPFLVGMLISIFLGTYDYGNFIQVWVFGALTILLCWGLVWSITQLGYHISNLMEL
tara:strand:+ start:695 stop:913 length:219 start_codon:yes stop_codon:yes gene_type:complete